MALAGLNQGDIASKMGVSRSAVSELLTGNHSPGLDRVDKLAAALEVRPFIMIMSDTERTALEAGPSDIQKIQTQMDMIMREVRAQYQPAPSSNPLLIRLVHLANLLPPGRQASLVAQVEEEVDMLLRKK
jgi:transcriptional regulator with XRE-family HTH domain